MSDDFKEEKVTITITADEYSVVAELGGGTVTQRHTMKSAGQSQQVHGGDWYEILPDDGDVAEALEELSFGPFAVAGALHRRVE